jgi:NTP pyrophosphatase (non-canonical NTP hydrolase)
MAAGWRGISGDSMNWTGFEKLKSHLDEVVNVTWNFAKRLDRQQDHEGNAMDGMVAEAGECLDIHKKKWYHTEKPEGFYREKLVLELGDVVYYMLKTMDLNGIGMDEILAGNRAKLESRHPELGKVTERFNGQHIR